MSRSWSIPRLIALTDIERFPQAVFQLGQLCGEAQARSVAIVLRDRQLSMRERCGYGETLRALTRASDQMLLVADRLDLCLALDADGVHLGSDALLPSQIRSQVSWLSRSIHRIDQIGSSEVELLDGVLVSPAFALLKGRKALESEGLTHWTSKLATPRMERGPAIYALGGISHVNVPSALAAGCVGVACISALMDPHERYALLSALDIVRKE